MSHNCGTTCKRKQTPPVPCSTCRLGGGNASGKGRKAHATPQMVGAAVDMYFDGISYRRTAENVHEYFGRETDGLTSYQGGVSKAFPLHPVKHVVSQGIRAQINNNLSERLQGTFRDRDKTLRSLKKRDSGQNYLDGLVLNYNYFRPHGGLKGKRPAEAAGAEIPFANWQEVATIE